MNNEQHIRGLFVPPYIRETDEKKGTLLLENVKKRCRDWFLKIIVHPSASLVIVIKHSVTVCLSMEYESLMIKYSGLRSLNSWAIPWDFVQRSHCFNFFVVVMGWALKNSCFYHSINDAAWFKIICSIRKLHCSRKSVEIQFYREKLTRSLMFGTDLSYVFLLNYKRNLKTHKLILIYPILC